MAKDYKYRVQSSNEAAGQGSRSSNPFKNASFWRGMLITFLIIFFVVLLVYWQAKKHQQTTAQQNVSLVKPQESEQPNKDQAKQKQNAKTEAVHEQPRFDFYTILPEKEVVVPDYEIKTRTREERMGKAKEASYIMQAGSFKSFKEADTFRAKLGLLGIESKVHKGKVGNITWYRVKIGPYSQMTSVSAIKARLRQNGIDVLVTESSE